MLIANFILANLLITRLHKNRQLIFTGLLVSAICKEENTAVMMLVGTFYTNLILAGIIWPIEAMPHWLRPLSYAQPQTLPTDTLRHILSRGWGITDSGVLLGFGVTLGWLVIFLMAAGLIFKYSR